ncbi:junctophilin-1-like [Babylonia areolata]|uniref:junctophilin-1-like n=1 Tax=Babylonia areolata TaxID=304850 RepID=UPI003FD54EAD
MTTGGGRFDFDDGGSYCGGWEEGKAHGQGVCTGPKGQGEFAGAWHYGFEVSGIYTWPSGNNYRGQWFQGKRHGLGIESKGRWVYRGEWTQGFKGRYGLRHSTSSGARYEGTWTTGLQDGYGCESYADGGTYQGQWYRGTRHGYGVRASVPYGLASHYRPKDVRASLTSLRSENEDDLVQKNRDRKLDEARGGFVLKARSDETPPQRRRSIFNKPRSSLRRTLMSGLKLKKQKSTGDIVDSPQRQLGSVRSTMSNLSQVSVDSAHSALTNTSNYTDSNLSFVSQDDITDVDVTETYMGEWKNDKRSGLGISERSDGLKYEGEWYNNRKYGYGMTTFKDGTREEGKYKNNVLISSGGKSKLFLVRTSKMRERVDSAVLAAQRAAQIALLKADIAITRMANARAKAEQADRAAEKAEQDSDQARQKATLFDPDFHQPGPDIMKHQQNVTANNVNYDPGHVMGMSANHAPPRHYQDHTSSPSPYTHLSPDPRHPHAFMEGGVMPGLPGGGGGGMMLPPGGTMPVQESMYQTSMAPSSAQQQHQQQQQQQQRTPSVKIRRYSFLAGSRHSRGFNDVFNSTVLTDHFDQYSSEDRADSGHAPTPSSTQQAAHPPAGRRDTDTDMNPDKDSRQQQPFLRRRTIPCIAVPPEDEEGTGSATHHQHRHHHHHQQDRGWFTNRTSPDPCPLQRGRHGADWSHPGLLHHRERNPEAGDGGDPPAEAAAPGGGGRSSARGRRGRGR